MTCIYCGHAKERHGTVMPSSDAWHYCQDCSNYNHVFKARDDWGRTTHA